MKTLLLLAVIMAFALLQVHGALWNFATMIKHTTGKTALLSYGAYGCYCGLRGRGAPKDATDWCCWAHDCCYKQLKHHGCGTMLLKYNVSIRRGQITCETSQEPFSLPVYLERQAQIWVCMPSSLPLLPWTARGFVPPISTLLQVQSHV
nr:phospholipase A2, membrane associated-like isoform X1 [Odocoileus virginianus texanus]